MEGMDGVKEKVKGDIRRAYEVWCGCGWWLALGSCGGSARIAAGVAREYGWKFNSKQGWVCPACQKKEKE